MFQENELDLRFSNAIDGKFGKGNREQVLMENS